MTTTEDSWLQNRDRACIYQPLTNIICAVVLNAITLYDATRLVAIQAEELGIDVREAVMRKLVLGLVIALALVGVGVGSAAATEAASASGCTKNVYKLERDAPVYTYASGSAKVKFTARKGNIFVYEDGTGAVNGSLLGDVYTSGWTWRGDGWVWKGHLDWWYCK